MPGNQGNVVLVAALYGRNPNTQMKGGSEVAEIMVRIITLLANEIPNLKHNVNKNHILKASFNFGA